MRIAILLLALASSAFAQNVDLTGWNALLGKHVNDRGLVSYRAWKAADAPALDGFLAKLAAANPAAFPNNSEKLAFWINAYNACVIKGVLTAYPTESVMKVPNFFANKAFTVAGEKVSLDDIEHKKIRPVFNDARVHAALVCAAISCPRLVNRAYTAVGLDAALDGQVREFLADPAKNAFDPAGPTAKLSQIFRWFAADFTASAGSVIAFVKKYAPAAAQGLLANPALKIQHLEYDWKLNAQ